MTTTQYRDVLVVGAGPSGLLAGCLLDKHGIDFIIIEKRKTRKTTSGALVIHPASLEIFAQLNLTDKIIDAGTIVNSISIHWSNHKSIDLSLINNDDELTGFPYLLLLEQFKLEQILTDYLSQAGYDIIRDHTLISIHAINQTNSIIIANGNGVTSNFKCRYLIGADGTSSTTRKLLNIPLKQLPVSKPIFIMDLKSPVSLKNNHIAFNFGKEVSLGIFALKNGMVRVDGTVPSTLLKSGVKEYGDIKHLLPFETNQSEVTWFSTFSSTHILASKFSKNNCFLIGDAAHTHNPVGGQGMNSGFQDAINLVWKIAWVIKQNANPEVLESYVAERKPVVESIMNGSKRLFNFITAKTPIHRHLWLNTGFFLSRLMATLFITTAIRKSLIKSISQLGIKYKSSLVIQNRHIEGPKPGERMIHHSLYQQILEFHHFKLLIFTAQELQGKALKFKDSRLLIQVISKNELTGSHFKRLKIKESRVYLIRPDNFIAYASNELDFRPIIRYLNELFYGKNTI